ncbi:MAG TPA: LysM domain-containing protein [Gaiellaceae bacterium]|nr:LysM domain-containing protein [Gaiellaceae bacterium]
MIRGHDRIARYAAPAAFLLAATIAILLIRAGLDSGDASTPVTPATTAVTTVETGETATETTTGPTTTDPAGAEFYEIQSGDTLAIVADQFDTTVEQLLVLNPDVDPVALTIGQRIRVK